MGALDKVRGELRTLCKNIHIAKQAQHDSRLVLVLSMPFLAELRADPGVLQAMNYPSDGTRRTVLGIPYIVDGQQGEPFKFVMEF